MSATATATTATIPDQVPYRERMRAWTVDALRDVVYSGAVFLWSIVAFAVLVTGVSVTASVLVLVVGVVVWIGFAYAMRWATSVDRRLAGWQRREPVRAEYRRPESPGFMPLLRSVTRDPQTWRDMGWMGVTSIVGFALGLLAITAVAIVIAYVSMPVWYWAISNSPDEYGFTNLGFLTIDTFGEAMAASAIGLVLAPLALALARGTAAAHARIAARMLGPDA